MITTDQELNNPEQLKVMQPELDQEKIQAEAQYMADLPQQPVNMDQGVEVASLSAWGARNLLKTLKPVEKTVRKKGGKVNKKTSQRNSLSRFLRSKSI